MLSIYLLILMQTFFTINTSTQPAHLKLAPPTTTSAIVVNKQNRRSRVWPRRFTFLAEMAQLEVAVFVCRSFEVTMEPPHVRAVGYLVVDAHCSGQRLVACKYVDE